MRRVGTGAASPLQALVVLAGLGLASAAWPCNANINWPLPTSGANATTLFSDWRSTNPVYCKWQAATAANAAIPTAEDVVGAAYTHDEAPNYTDSFFLIQLADGGLPGTTYAYVIDHPGIAGSNADSVLTVACTNATTCTTTVNVTGGTCGGNLQATYDTQVTKVAQTSYILSGGANFPAAYYSCFDNTDYNFYACPKADDTSVALCKAHAGSTEQITSASPNDFNGATAASVRKLEMRVDPSGVELTWETGSELRNYGFIVHRGGPQGPRVNPQLIPGLNTAPVGRQYRFHDPDGDPGREYYLEAVGHDGSHFFGPAQLRSALTSPPPPRADLHRPALRSSRSSVASVGVDQVFARTTAEGLYRIDRQALIDSGFTSLSYTLSIDGRPVPLVSLGGDASLFYAPPVTAADRSDDAYQLDPAPVMKASALASAQVRCTPGPTASATFPATINVAQHQIFDPGASPDLRFPWIFAASGAGAAEVTFDTPGYAGGEVTVAVHLLGMSDFGVNPEHHAVMTVNGHSLPDAEFGGLDEVVFSGHLPAGAVHPTGNTLSLTAVADLDGVPYDLIGLSSIDVSYQRSYRALNDALHFTAPGGSRVRLSGFSETPIVVDLTDPQRPRAVTPNSCGGPLSGPGGGSFVFEASGTGARSFYASVPRAGPLSPSRAGEVPLGSAQWVAVVGDGLDSALEPLAALRRSQGLSVLTVPAAALFDRFARGQHGAAAIQAYLAQLSPPPDNVVLVGRASLDPHDYLATGTPDLVPTRIIVTSDLQTVAAFDDGLVAGADGRTPFTALGRIPSSTPDELKAFVSKLVAFEGGPGPSGQALFAADYQDPDGSLDPFFESESDQLASQIGQQVTKVYLPSQDTADLLSGLALSPDLVTYHGHADGLDWSSSGLLSDSNLSAFPNQRPFLLVTVDCWDGMFAMPTFDALAQSMVGLSQGGAIAAFSASSLVNEVNDPTIDGAIFPLLQGSQLPTVGQITRQAMTTLAAVGGQGSELVRVYNLIGDPATRNPLY